MLIRYFLLFCITTGIIIAASEIEISNKARLEKYSEQYSKARQKRSRLKGKKRKIDAKVQYLRDKMNDEEANADEPAKLYALMQKQKDLSEKIAR